MIRIVRRSPTPDMTKKAQAVTREIVAYLKKRDKRAKPVPAGVKPPKDEELARLVSKYGDAGLGLKVHLLAETHDKCAYCESKVTHVAFGDIEHVVPKALRPDLAVELSNLTIACGVCNNNKSDYYDERARLVDPHADDGRAEIAFFGWNIVESMCGARGKHTLRELELNREPLTKRRSDHFNKLGELVSSWKKETDPEMRYALLLSLWDYGLPMSEYSSMALTALDHCQVERLP